jgi:hypothetical protein
MQIRNALHFSAELSKKKDKEAGEGPSSGPEQKKLDALAQTDSEEEEETLQLERRKRPAPPPTVSSQCRAIRCAGQPDPGRYAYHRTDGEKAQNGGLAKQTPEPTTPRICRSPDPCHDQSHHHH